MLVPDKAGIKLDGLPTDKSLCRMRKSIKHVPEILELGK